MSFMFKNATDFNQPIGDWETSSVENMDSMFFGASLSNQDLSLWCVSQLDTPTDFNTDSAFESEPDFQPRWQEPCLA